jgi:hypothetical protein
MGDHIGDTFMYVEKTAKGLTTLNLKTDRVQMPRR